VLLLQVCLPSELVIGFSQDKHLTCLVTILSITSIFKRQFSSNSHFRSTWMVAGPGEGFLLELDGNANLQVGGKVPKVAIALTRFSILGLQARAVGDTRGNNTKSARIPQFGRILSAKEGGDTSAAGVDELAGQLLAENTAVFGDDKTIPEAVAGLESSIANTKGKADGSGGPWRPIMQDLNSYILERLSISCTIERAPIIENRHTWKWRNAWHGQCSVSGLDFAITTSEVQVNAFACCKFLPFFLLVHEISRWNGKSSQHPTDSTSVCCRPLLSSLCNP
jgi:hypothetical protein